MGKQTPREPTGLHWATLAGLGTARIQALKFMFSALLAHEKHKGAGTAWLVPKAKSRSQSLRPAIPRALGLRTSPPQPPGGALRGETRANAPLYRKHRATERAAHGGSPGGPGHHRSLLQPVWGLRNDTRGIRVFFLITLF